MTRNLKNTAALFLKRSNLKLKKRHLFYFVFVVGIVASVCVATGFAWWVNATSPAGSDTTLRSFVIPKGLGATGIADKLAAEGLINNTVAFKIYTRVNNLAGKIPAGEYRVAPSMNLTQLITALTSGPYEIWVTVPEGLRREQVAIKFATEFGKNPAEAQQFIDEFLAVTPADEGRLFPDTYLVPPSASASAVAALLRSTFAKKMTDEIQVGIENQGLSVAQGITLASLIERETLNSSERPMVAGILLNRLNAGWPLQVDATIQYILATRACQSDILGCETWWPKDITKADLAIVSPYNTYKVAALPPAPIANPSLTSLEAVAFPINNNYWFYLHDASGAIHYGSTLEEHNANIAKYLQ